MISRIIAVAVLGLTSVLCQNELNLNVKIGGFDFNLSFNPGVTAPAALARKFCLEQGGRFDITMDTLDNCVTPVTSYLQKEVELAKQKALAANVPQKTSQTDNFAHKDLKPVLAKFKIADIDYELTFHPTLVSTEQVALQFCQQKGGEFGITAATLGTCTNAVHNHIAGIVNDYNKSATASATPKAEQYRTVTVDLTIEDQQFNLKFQPDVTPTNSVATKLCTEKGASFGVTNANLAYCIKSVAEYLDAEVRK